MSEIQRAFAAALCDPQVRARLNAVLGWDDSTIDAVAASRRGVKLDEIPAFISACGLTAVRTELFDAYVVFAKIGATCALNKGRGVCS